MISNIILGIIALSAVLFGGGQDLPQQEQNLGAATSTIVQNLFVKDLADCNTIDTNSAGFLSCGTDEGGAGSGITSLNGLSTTTQVFATTTSSGVFNLASTGFTHTLTLPSNVGFFTNDAGYVTSTHAAATLAGEDYLSLSGQQITANAIDPDNLSASDFGDFTCNGTSCVLDATYLTTSTGLTTANFATTSISQWVNDAGYVTSSVGGSGSVTTSTPITVNHFPYWVTTGGGLAGTSTLSISGTTLNATGTITQSGVAVHTTATGAAQSTTISAGGLLTGGGDLSTNRTITFASSSLGLGTASVENVAAFLQPGNNLSELTSTSTARTNLGLAIGTNVQAYDADLTTYAGITPSANVQTLLGSADYSAFKTSLSLNNVENTALSTWAGTSNITTLGTITTGTWTATDIAVNAGGTGTSTAPFDKSILTGEGGAYAQKTLTAGTGISIATSSTAITLANSLTTCTGNISFATTGSVSGFNIVDAQPVGVTSTVASVAGTAGVGTDAVTFNLFLATNRSSATSTQRKLFSSYQSLTATTTRQSFTINGSTTISSADMLFIDLQPASTTDASIKVCFTPQ